MSLQTTEKVFEMMDSIVEEVGKENVIQVVIDNSANYKVVGHLLMTKRKRLFWTTCAAHCVDLMLEDYEKKILVRKQFQKVKKLLPLFIQDLL